MEARLVEQTIQEKIRQKRAQMLVHSCIYYLYDDSLVTDHTWQAWADELVELQKDYKDPIGFYDEAFKDWDASTGYHLPKDEYVVNKALHLLRRRDKNNVNK